MKEFKLIILMLTMAISGVVSAQVTIKIEELSKPESLLRVKKVSMGESMLSMNVDADSLAYFDDKNPFFYGMYDAYADHRPFVLSPDMIWLLISQGFSHHINANPEKYRDRMVDFSGKLSLVIESDRPLDSAKWDVLIPQFAEEIKKNTKGTIAEAIIADFSTTTNYELIASEITLMEVTKPFFEFVAIYIACGIPEVTLLGTVEDWQKIYDRAMQLRSYDLDWWIDELEPILKQFIEASKGNADVRFWRNMFKWHTQKEYGAPNIIDGWIVKFYPYDKDGKRFDLKTLTIQSNLPEERAEADVRFIEIDENGFSTETMIELHGGFMGLEQNPETFALTPKIGWEVMKKIDEDSTNLARMNEQLRRGGRIALRVKEIPEVLSKIDTIRVAELQFKDTVYFPEWMKDKQIERLWVYGEISTEERLKLLSWYPSAWMITVNDANYSWEDGVLDVSVRANIGSALDGIDTIGTLYINNKERKGFYLTGKTLDVIIPENVTTQLETISLSAKPSRKNMKALQKQFPNTIIYLAGEVVTRK